MYKQYTTDFFMPGQKNTCLAFATVFTTPE